MRGTINDALRELIGAGTRVVGGLLEAVQAVRIRTFRFSQRYLRWRYGIRPDTPILCYGPEIRDYIRQTAARAGKGWVYALTSGSTAEPKRLLYTPGRLRRVKWTFLETFIRACRAFRIRRTSLFAFTVLAEDDSLTSLMVREVKAPGYFATLPSPYRIQAHPAVRGLAVQYGPAAVRLWLLALSNPGVLYATNPSTLVALFDEVSSKWEKSSRLVKDFCRKAETLDPRVYHLARRLVSRGSQRRLELIAHGDSFLPLEVWAPGVEAYTCWTGGYLQPFLDRLERYLPSHRYTRIPMYSMSTETIETVSHFCGPPVAFLPLAPGVLYEFLPEGKADLPGRLRAPDELQAGSVYTLVVSDAYGLRRYQTGDLFLCRGMIRGLPDLQFQRRRGLEYSFTGEKITAEQIGPILQTIRQKFPLEDRFLTCVPSWPPEEPIPHYRLLIVSHNGAQARCDLGEPARWFDELLAAANGEYRSKRETHRLGAVRTQGVRFQDFIAWAGGARHRDTWEAQFKFLPLYTRLWDMSPQRKLSR